MTPDHQCDGGMEALEEAEEVIDSNPCPCPFGCKWDLFCENGIETGDACEECEYLKTEVGLNSHIMNDDHEP